MKLTTQIFSSRVLTAALAGMFAVMIASCAPKQKTADAPVLIAQDTAIVLQVTDARDSGSVIVQTGGESGVADVDLIAILEQSARATFFGKGYRLVTANDEHAARVEVALRKFHLDISKKLLTETEQVSAVIAVTANRGGKTVKKTYQAGTEKRALKTSKVGLREKIHTALDALLLQVARDAELENFIVQGS